MSGWKPGLVVAPDGRQWVRIEAEHGRYLRDRSYRRSVLREVRRLMRQHPDAYGDLLVSCETERSCCGQEDIEVTLQRVTEALEDWTGVQALSVIGHAGYEAARRAGMAIYLPGGEVVP